MTIRPRPPARRRGAARDGEHSALLSFVSKLYYLDGQDQSEIARIAGTSRSSISRLLTEARERGVVRISVDEHDQRARALEAELARRFPLRRVVVVRPPGATRVEHVRRAIGYVAAPAIAEVIRSRGVIGVAGGRTLADLVRYMTPARGVSNVRVVQLMGNIGPAADAIDAIELSRALAHHFGGTCYALNAPAFAADARAQEVFVTHPHMREVWDLFRRMDLALVGIGTLTDSAFIERGVLEPRVLDELRHAGAVGEICGRFFDRAGAECATDCRRRVIASSFDDLRRAEVVAVTNGAHRADAIRAALAGRLITSLVIDEAGAQAVLEQPSPSTPPRRPAGLRGGSRTPSHGTGTHAPAADHHGAVPGSAKSARDRPRPARPGRNGARTHRRAAPARRRGTS
jgi:deoxyribonucleoside regulator